MFGHEGDPKLLGRHLRGQDGKERQFAASTEVIRQLPYVRADLDSCSVSARGPLSSVVDVCPSSPPSASTVQSREPMRRRRMRQPVVRRAHLEVRITKRWVPEERSPRLLELISGGGD